MPERRVVVVGYDGALLLDIASVTSTLGVANLVGDLRDRYVITLATPGGRPISCGPGTVLQSGQALERVTGPLDTLVVSGGVRYAAAADDARLVADVRRLAHVSRRVASVCTGAAVLAATGLLDGRRVTTHWRFAPTLAERHPAVVVDPDPIYLRDGRFATSAGVTSGLDLTLAFIAEDHGAELARAVARDLVTYLQRPGNQAQMSMFTSTPPTDHDVVRRVLDHVGANLGGDVGTEALAAVGGVTPRHLTRLFLAHVGKPPGRYVRRARTEAAAHLVASTTLPLPAVAARCGFGSAETLRQAFVHAYGVPPSRYRALHRAG
ncbi:MAG TPA: helix-turn-helix domain-containing protein [Mycobacteriales bacterium]|nr:helix-turn-helix domain-containing protein [Mycobacteriales bacterium]